MAVKKEMCRVCGKQPGKEFRGTGFCGKHQSYLEQMEAAKEVEYAIREDLESAAELRNDFKHNYGVTEEEENLMYEANASGLSKYSQSFEGVTLCRENDYSIDMYLDCRSALTHGDSLKFIELGSQVDISDEEVFEIGEGSYVDGLEKVSRLKTNMSQVGLDIRQFDVSPDAIEFLDEYNMERPADKDLASYVKSNQESVVKKIKEISPSSKPSDLSKSYKLWEKMMKDEEVAASFARHLMKRVDSEVQ